MKIKKWLKYYTLASLPLLIIIAAFIFFVDPYFHYHKPHTDLFFYELSSANERYVNDGIIRNFDYDAIISGTSMSENFKASDFVKYFPSTPIKVPFNGGTLYEISSRIEKAYEKHDVKYVLRSLDYYILNNNSTEKRTHFKYPEYLYNDNPIDDVKYLCNATVLNQIISNISKKSKGIVGITDFDEYANWMSNYTFGKKEVLKSIKNISSTESNTDFTQKDEKRVAKNIQKNIVDQALSHPETQFYYFLPPYSLAYWGTLYENGELGNKLTEEAIAVRLIVQCDNIHLFSFNEREDWISNLDNYKDTVHYNEQINAEMLKLMSEDKFRITKENAEDYIKFERDFFLNYDYNRILTE